MMIDDIGEGYAPIRAEMWQGVKALWEFQVKRQDAEKWALREMKFLIYDDDTESNSHGHSDDDDEMLDDAIEISMGNGSSAKNNHEGKTVIKDEPEPTMSHKIHPGKDEDDAECVICSDLPEFPHTRKTRRFRLINPVDECKRATKEDAETLACIHYIAVSYRWPEAKKDKDGKIIPYKGSYQVRDRNGKIRNNRALDSVLDRAVDFANCHGLRMIWIDQECLPQPTEKSPQADKDYQEAGLQAMDIVYNRAMATAGLHDGIISSQEQLETIKSLIEFDKNREIGLEPTPQFIISLLQFLKMVSSDMWYTRAWVVQESMSAGSGLSLVFGRGVNVKYPSTFRKNGPRRPKHSLDSPNLEQESNIICIPVRDFQRVIRSAKHMLDPNFTPMGMAIWLTMETAEPVLALAEALHPEAEKNENDFIHVYWANIYGGRQKVDAAGAMSLLKTRKCYYCHDRVVIMANMCSYNIRLNTSMLGKYCPSLRIGYLALALLNGDLSLLVPELYLEPYEDPMQNTSRLLSPFDTDPGRIQYCVVQDTKLALPRLHAHTIRDTSPEYISLPAYTWTVDDTIDLTIIQEKWADAWNELKCIQTVIPALEGESELQYDRRKGLIMQQLSRPNIIRRIKKELLRHGVVSPSSTVWGGHDATGAECKAILIAQRVESSPKMQGTIANIFFDILRYLLFTSETDPRAIGVANSIWHSIRMDAVDRRRQLPDEVCEALFEHPDVVQNPFKVLQLDRNRHATYTQIWIIDRIMHHGILWIGRYNRISTPEPEFDEKTPHLVETKAGQASVSYISAVFDLLNREIHPQIPSNASSEGVKGKASEGLESEKVVEEESEKEEEEEEEKEKEKEKEKEEEEEEEEEKEKEGGNDKKLTGILGRTSAPPGVNAESLAYLALALSHKTSRDEVEEERSGRLVSVFDVNGPCLVATPFDATWERLPRPEIRGMSVCWVVQPVLSEKDATGYKANAYKDERAARDATTALNAYNDLGSTKASSSRLTTEPKVEEPTRGGYSPKENAAYRVLGKVKGMWQIMEFPVEEYRFM